MSRGINGGFVVAAAAYKEVVWKFAENEQHKINVHMLEAAL